MTTPEYLDLHWPDGEPDALFVRGHVTPDEFRAIVTPEWEDAAIIPTFDAPVQRWGAWRMNGQDEDGNPRRSLFTYPERGRGMFPVTVADVTRWDAGTNTYPAFEDREYAAGLIERDKARARMANQAIGVIDTLTPPEVLRG
jgi:hypothetical protein